MGWSWERALQAKEMTCANVLSQEGVWHLRGVEKRWLGVREKWGTIGEFKAEEAVSRFKFG